MSLSLIHIYLWVANPPSGAHAAAGATVVANLSASDETIGKSEYRRMLVQSQSARSVCAYLYACLLYTSCIPATPMK